MPPNRSRIRRGEAPQFGVACENPSLEPETAQFFPLVRARKRIRAGAKSQSAAISVKTVQQLDKPVRSTAGARQPEVKTCNGLISSVTSVSCGACAAGVKYFVDLFTPLSTKPFRWRIVLSTVNLAAAIMLSALGAREYNVFRHLHRFHEGNVLYIPPAQLASYCVNVPAFVFSNLVGNSRVWKFLWGGVTLSRADSALFYVSLTIFWWWIGWRIDIRSRRGSVKALAAPFWVTAVLLSLLLIYAGLQIFLIYRVDSVSGGRAVAIAMLVWGVALLYYCGRMLMNW
jgi:hypothetical protein